MNHQAILDRVLRAVDATSYLPLADSVDTSVRDVMAELQQKLQAPAFSRSDAEAFVHRVYQEGKIDKVLFHSALHVIAASPKVRDFPEAARQASEQELAALESGGPRLELNLASVDRHRGVLAFLMGKYEVALDYFTRSFERQRSAGNLVNILATLLRLGEEPEARSLLLQMKSTFPADLVDQVDRLILRDPDLALLRDTVRLADS